jgi:hypothetical protein
MQHDAIAGQEKFVHPNEPVTCPCLATKTEVLLPPKAMALDTLAGVRGQMARLYRLD